MKCPNCKEEIKDDSKYCKKCGKKIEKVENNKQESEKTTKYQEIIEKNIVFEEKKEKVNNIDQIRNIKTDNILISKLLEIWKKLNLFEKIVAPFGIIIILSLLVALIANKSGSVIVAIIQLVGIGATILMEKNIIRTNKNWIKYVILAICFLLIGSYISFFKVHTSKSAEPIIWSELVLGEMIPEIKNHNGEINSNSDERLDIDIFNISSKEFYSYIDSCKDKGYTIDEIKKEYSFEAYTEEGYKIKIYYSDYSNELDIDLSKPETFEEIEWLTNDFAKLLPTPKSNLGKIIENSEKIYKVKISNMTIDDFNDYISQCEEKGFNVDSNKTDKRFTAKNNSNNKLEIEYTGNNIIMIRIEEPIYEVQLKINFVENWVFSKYDVKLYVDDNYESELSHGEDEEFSLKLNKGKHRVKFVNSEDDNVKGYIDLEIDDNQTIELKINCYSSEVSIQNNSKNSDTSSSTNTSSEDQKETNESSSNQTEISKEATSSPVSYSTNTKETVKNGNTGIYSYKKSGSKNAMGGWYDIYYIIDFDEGYVYYFLEGYESEKDAHITCDKVKITSGDLNSKLIFTYHDGSDNWSECLHFKYKNQPDHLIWQSNNGDEADFYTTNLEEALKIRDKKKINNY